MGRGFTANAMQCQWVQCQGWPVMQMQMQRRLTAGANRGTLGGASGRQTECCFVRPGEERRTALGLLLFFGAQGLRRCRQGTVMRVWGGRGGKGEREREARWLDWMKAAFSWGVTQSHQQPAVPGLMFAGTALPCHHSLREGCVGTGQQKPGQRRNRRRWCLSRPMYGDAVCSR